MVSEAAPRVAAPVAAMQEQMQNFTRSASEYFPMIRRGFVAGEETEEESPEMAVGFKHDVASRKDREMSLR